MARQVCPRQITALCCDISTELYLHRDISTQLKPGVCSQTGLGSFSRKYSLVTSSLLPSLNLRVPIG